MKQRGFVLITFYLFLVVLLVQAVAVLAYTLSEMKAAERSQASVRALYLAEAGVDQAVASLRNAQFVGRVADSAADPEIRQSTMANGQTHVAFESDVDPVAGRLNVYRIRATGYYPARNLNNAASTFQDRVLEVYSRVDSGQQLPPGLVGDRGVTLSGSVRVDSYDSSRSTVPRSTGHGLIGSNGTAPGTITISGSVDVFGDVLAGPGAPRSAIHIRGSSRVSGTIGAATEAYDVTPVSESAGTEDLSLSGNRTMTLPGGTYRWKQVSISGGAQLQFTGPATIYADTLSLSGNSITTADSRPTHLAIKVPGGGGVSLSGATGFYGLIYAPESQISLSGGNTLHGAVVGRTISLSGSVNFWYDEALNGPGGGGGSNQVTVLSWTEGA